MKKIILIIFALGLFSCSHKICLTTHDGTKTKTIKYRGDVVVDENYVRFTTIKGTKQAPPVNMYKYKISN